MSKNENPWVAAATGKAATTSSGATVAGNPWATLVDGEGGEASPPTTTHAVPATRPSRRVRVAEDREVGSFEAFLHGAADTVTFGFLDEAGAFIDSNIPEWAGGSGKSYLETLRDNRALLKHMEEKEGGAYFAGQLAGALVPVVGGAGRVKAAATAVKTGRAAEGAKLAVSAGAQGAVYGYGSGESESLFSTERVKNAAFMGLTGAGVGFGLGAVILPAARSGADKAMAVISRGSVPKLNFKFKKPQIDEVTDDVAEDLTATRLKHAKAKPAPAAAGDTPAPKPKRYNSITGQAEDVAEDGALFSSAELREAIKSQTGRDILFEKIAKLGPAEARVAAQKLEKAMGSGDMMSDPHFRSLLGLDLTDVTDAVDDAVKAADVFKELSDAILEKAGMGTKTIEAQQRGLRARYGRELSEEALDDLVEKTQAAEGAANAGVTVMALAGVRFAKATHELLPQIRSGIEGAREKLAEELTTALRIATKGQYLVSAAGRNLGATRHSRKAIFNEVKDGGFGLETPESIRKRVDATLNRLSDDELNELVSRTRDLSDLNQLNEILADPEAAELVSNFIRARNSFGLWIKSNTLTIMSGAINVVGFLTHNPFRNHWARKSAAKMARREGREADAMILEAQIQARNAVRWQAHVAGLRAGLNRIKWEGLDSFEKIVGVAGWEKGASKAAQARSNMIGKGYTPPEIREFDRMERAAVTDWRGFNKRLAERQGGFAPLINAMERAGAVGLNTLDAVGTATARVISGVLDDAGRGMIKMQEAYAESAGHAMKEGIERGLEGKELNDFVVKRATELAELPPLEILRKVEAKLVDDVDLDDTDRMLLRRDWKAEREAEASLFMDGPQTMGGRVSAAAATGLDTLAGGFVFPGILMTYIRTPIRIFERGLASYTPWAGKIAETQAILARGGTEAAIERARIDLGTTVIGIGMMASAAGVINVTNGGYKNSKNLTGEPPNRLNLPGGAFVELSRLDPFSLSLAMGGIIGQMWKASQEAEDRYGHDDALSTALATAFAAARESIFEKSYMTGARDLMEALSQLKLEATADYAGELLTSAITRAVPLSGISRQINETIHGEAIEAIGFMDQLRKVIPGWGTALPTRIDPLGNEVDGRIMGLAVGTTNDVDDLTKRIADLGIDITALKKADPAGFDLTSEELSELRKIRATEAQNADGQTMREALEELLGDPEFQRLPDRSQVQSAVVDVMSKFNNDARAIFEERNQGYLAEREAHRSFEEYVAQNIERSEARVLASEDNELMGLQAPTRLIP